MPIGTGLALALGAMMAGGQAASSVAGSISARRGQKSQQALDLQIEQMRDKRERELAADSNALQESSLNPYRGQLAQARSMGALDAMRRSRYTPFQLESGPYTAPLSGHGGFSFEGAADPLMDDAQGALYNSVVDGETPANKNKRGGVNVLSLLANAYGPRTA